VSYEVGSDEFLIGGAGGCDLRLPIPNLPPVVCQLTRKSDGVKIRRLVPGLPVLHNGHPLPSNTASAVSDADRLIIAGLEITLYVQHVGFVSPKLIPLDPYETDVPEAPSTTLPGAVERDASLQLGNRRREFEAEEAARRAEWGRQDGDLIRRQRDLDRQTEELETDRVLWYRRRQEMEQEIAHAKASLNSPPQGVAEKEAQLAAWEAELNRVREELTTLREQLVRQHHKQRNSHVQTQDAVSDADARLEADRLAFEAECDRERQRVRNECAERLRLADEEIARRKATAEAELSQQEARLGELQEQRIRLTAGNQELARQRDLFAADREIFDKARAALERDQKKLEDRDEALARREEQARLDAEAFARDRQELQEDLVRRDRFRAELDERARALEARTAEAEIRFEQLRRDAAEWEETIRIAAAEQDRLRAEGERFDRQKAELDSQTAQLAERAAQLEAQQAVIAVLRSKLDRTRVDVEREASILAAARVREDDAQAELRARIREAEQLRAELNIVQESTLQDRRRLDDQDSLLAVGLEEIRQQKEALAAREERLREREAALDARAAEFAEHAGALKGRLTQAFDLNSRLEADRVAIREREAALAQAEEARQSLQEQLRRRAEDLLARGKSLDELARQLTSDKAAVDAERAAVLAARQGDEEWVNQLRAEVEARAAEISRESEAIREREETLSRQVLRVKEVGAAVADERSAMVEARARWEADRVAAEQEARATREALEAFRDRIASEIEALRTQAPDLDDQARAALDRLNTARDTLRGHLTELNNFARQSRDDLDAVRTEIRAEAERIREQQTTLDRARAEHRLAVAGFRQQLVEWQGRVAEMKRGLVQSESRLDARQAAVDEAARHAEVTTQHLAEEAERLRREHDDVVQKRSEMERHLTDMREWYRRKLRELAAGRVSSDADMPTLKLHDPSAPNGKQDPAGPDAPALIFDDLNPGDRQLGELLRSLELVDAETVTALWGEAGRQRKTLRQVLLTNNALSLYQLALIEAGNLDGLMLGRFRVIDRLRVTPREAMYRVFDPTRAVPDPTPGGAGVFLFRHLSETETQDAVRPDEFRQRFRAARASPHPNLAAVVEVLDVNGRPAVLEEWLAGLFSADWPAHAAHPGSWVRLMTMAASGLDAAHRAGLIHGRLTSDSFVLTAAGVLKITGVGEPLWLAGSAPTLEPTAGADLRALGQVAFGWSQLAGKKRGARVKPFPPELVEVIRRLEADAEPPMADTVAADRPYESAADLLADLNRIARDTAFSDDAWEKLLKYVVDHTQDAPAPLRQSA
jgi:chromosome segregation ATPase